MLFKNMPIIYFMRLTKVFLLIALLVFSVEAQEALKPINPRSYSSHQELIQAVLERMNSTDLKSR